MTECHDGPRSVEMGGLLCHRMSTLGLAPEAIARAEPKLFGNLQKRCAGCDSHELCTSDMAHAGTDRLWVDYCANAALLTSLTEVWSFRQLL